MNTKLYRSGIGILVGTGLVCLMSAGLYAAEYNFAGVWKGESVVKTSGLPKIPGIQSFQRGGGGRGGGDAGGGAPTFGGANANGPQKITLRLKVKDTKASGNITIGTAMPDDIEDGVIEGNKLTFKDVVKPASGKDVHNIIYECSAVLNGDEMDLTRTPADGKGRTLEFKLKRN